MIIFFSLAETYVLYLPNFVSVTVISKLIPTEIVSKEILYGVLVSKLPTK